MPLTLALGIVDDVRIVTFFITLIICLCIRYRLALREAWFSSPSLSEDDRAVAPIRRPTSPALAVWTCLLIGLNIAVIPLWIVQLVHALHDGETIELIAQIFFGASRIVTLNTSIRSFYYLIKSLRAKTDAECEDANRMSRLFMLDGAYFPVLVLAYGGEAVEWTLGLACGMQSVAWACGVVVSLRDSQFAAKLISEIVLLRERRRFRCTKVPHARSCVASNGCPPSAHGRSLKLEARSVGHNAFSFPVSCLSLS